VKVGSRNLIIVLVLAAAASALLIGINGYLAAQEKRARDACWANLHRIAVEMEIYAGKHGGKYPYTLSELVPLYLKKIPTCPKTRGDTYSASYKRLDDHNFRIYCSGYNHARSGLPANQPSFDTKLGSPPFQD